MRSSVRRRCSGSDGSASFLLFVRVVLLQSAEEASSGGASGGCHAVGTKTSCRPHFHCAKWSCVVLSHSSRHRIESGRHSPVKSRSRPLPRKARPRPAESKSPNRLVEWSGVAPGYRRATRKWWLTPGALRAGFRCFGLVGEWSGLNCYRYLGLTPATR